MICFPPVQPCFAVLEPGSPDRDKGSLSLSAVEFPDGLIGKQLDFVMVPLLIINTDLCITFANLAATHLLNRNGQLPSGLVSERLGNEMSFLSLMASDTHRATIRVALNRILGGRHGGTTVGGVKVDIKPWGGDEIFNVNVSLKVYNTSQGVEVLVQMIDISDVVRMQKALQERAITDDLTGLRNRRYFIDEGIREFARARRHSFENAMMIIDIDHFKKVNDTYGHPVGDDVLVGVANVFLERVRCADIVARVGGEEFGVLLFGTSPPGAEMIAQSLIATIRQRAISTRLKPVSVTFSLGIAPNLDRFKSFDDWYEAADQELYRAKNGGRNCYRMLES